MCCNYCILLLSLCLPQLNQGSAVFRSRAGEFSECSHARLHGKLTLPHHSISGQPCASCHEEFEPLKRQGSICRLSLCPEVPGQRSPAAHEIYILKSLRSHLSQEQKRATHACQASQAKFRSSLTCFQAGSRSLRSLHGSTEQGHDYGGRNVA